MTDDIVKRLSVKQIEELERLYAATAPQAIDTAEYVEDGYYECPLCETLGHVEGRTFTNYDGHANGVQFFGIGQAHKDAEALFRKAISALPSLLAMAKRAALEGK